MNTDEPEQSPRHHSHTTPLIVTAGVLRNAKPPAHFGDPTIAISPSASRR